MTPGSQILSCLPHLAPHPPSAPTTLPPIQFLIPNSGVHTCSSAWTPFPQTSSTWLSPTFFKFYLKPPPITPYFPYPLLFLASITTRHITYLFTACLLLEIPTSLTLVRMKFPEGRGFHCLTAVSLATGTARSHWLLNKHLWDACIKMIK